MTEQEVAALADALAAEHAAVFGYGLVLARTAPERRAAVSAAVQVHEQQRDDLVDLLGAAAVPAAAGYSSPLDVVDDATALGLAVVVEEDGAAAWRSVLERSEPVTGGDTAASVRARALAALSGSAVRAAAWRRALGAVPATTAFPGRPTSAGG